MFPNKCSLSFLSQWGLHSSRIGYFWSSCLSSWRFILKSTYSWMSGWPWFWLGQPLLCCLSVLCIPDPFGSVAVLAKWHFVGLCVTGNVALLVASISTQIVLTSLLVCEVVCLDRLKCRLPTHIQWGCIHQSAVLHVRQWCDQNHRIYAISMVWPLTLASAAVMPFQISLLFCVHVTTSCAVTVAVDLLGKKSAYQRIVLIISQNAVQIEVQKDL